MQGFHPTTATVFFFSYHSKDRKKPNPPKLCMEVFKWLAILYRLWTHTDWIQRKRHREREERERAEEEDEGEKRRMVSEQLACCWAGVLSKALPPLHPPTHLPAHHQPNLTHSDILFPRLRAPRLGSATHRLQSTAECVGERVCGCVSFSKLCVVLQLNLLRLSSH